MPTEALALLLAFFTVAGNILGGVVVAFRSRLNPTALGSYLALAGGFLLASVFLEVIPEALEEGSDAAPYIALGFIAIYISEHLLEGFFAKNQRLAAPQEAVINPAAGLTSIVGWSAHEFFDGVALGAGFLTSPSLGVLMFLAIIAHDTGAGLSVAATVRGAGWGRKMAAGVAIGVGLMTVLGTALALIVGNISPFLTKVFLALAAGTFIHIAASDLLPAAAKTPSRFVFLWVLVGFGLFYGSERLLEVFL